MQKGKQHRLLAGSPRTRARTGGGKRLESQYRCSRTSPGPQRRCWILPLSIQPKRASASTNGAVRVHVSLNNSSINIQCFHYHQRRRGPRSRPGRTPAKLLRQHVLEHSSQENAFFPSSVQAVRRFCMFHS